MTARFDHKQLEHGHYNGLWVVHCPEAHPLWHDYCVLLYDLRISVDRPKALLARPGMTHEVMVFALHPDKTVDFGSDVFAQGLFKHLLHPPNHGYQFHAEDDAAAQKRVQGLVDAIVNGRLSPDTDFSAMWDALFRDGVSLKSTLFDALSAEQACKH